MLSLLNEKNIDIEEYKLNKSYDEDLENFLPIWKEYWEKRDIVQSFFSQMDTCISLLEVALLADIRYGLLDKKCKRILIKRLEAIINTLK